MTNKKTIDDQSNRRRIFISEFLKHPLQIGSIIPCTRFVGERVVKAADVASADVIVELGPGTGGVTRAILKAMHQNAKLLTIEINPRLYDIIKKIKDSRLIAHFGSADNLKQILAGYGLGAPDAVISGVPFSTMNPDDAHHILDQLTSLLNPKGRFTAYQLSGKVAELCRPYMGTADSSLEFFNIPPMRVFRWVKNGS